MSRTWTDRAALRRALELATHGPQADPNPRVGAVILDSGGAVVGEGWHCGAGTPHAEVVALDQAGTRARSGTAYITLEPCRHTGRTPPCADALIAAGVRRVVFAQADPNPAAAGGAATLSEAGIDVSSGLLAQEAAELNQAWSFAVAHHRPWVIWKTATTLDGRSTAADGTNRWITGTVARAAVHRLRAESGAVLIGTGTALADHPRLSVRDSAGQPMGRQPLPVVLGERDLPAGVLPKALQLRHRDPARALAELHSQGVRQVLLEGGPTLAAAFLRANLIDRVVLHLAPRLLGAGLSLPDFGIGTLAVAPHLTIRGVNQLGDDIEVIADLIRIREPRPN